jgi:hypothetical protein
MQMDVQVGSRAKALDQGDSTTLAFAALEPRVVQQMPFDHALHHLQHRRDQLGARCVGPSLEAPCLAGMDERDPRDLGSGGGVGLEEGV